MRIVEVLVPATGGGTSQVKKRIESYPRVRIEGGGRAVVPQAAAVLLVETVRKAGLDQAISTTLGPWRRPRAVHVPGKALSRTPAEQHVPVPATSTTPTGAVEPGAHPTRQPGQHRARHRNGQPNKPTDRHERSRLEDRSGQALCPSPTSASPDDEPIPSSPCSLAAPL